MSTLTRELRQRAQNRQIMERSKNDEALEDIELMQEWLPLIREMGSPHKYTGEELVRKLGKLGALKLALLAVGGKSEKVQAYCAREIAHMGGLKPVEKSANVNLHLMAETEIDALLQSKLEEIGIYEPKK